MRIFTFILFVVYTHNVLCDSSRQHYPKKAMPPIKDSKIILSRKVFDGKRLKVPLQKGPNFNKGYTVFAPVAENMGRASDSPFFAEDQIVDPKIRIKKVLPEYYHKIQKRHASAVSKVKSGDLKKNDTKDETKAPKSAKALSKNKKKKHVHRDARNLRQKKHLRSKGRRTHKKQRKTQNNSTKKSKKIKSNSEKIKPNSTKAVPNEEKKVKETKLLNDRAADTRRLVAARDAIIEDYPYVVSIQKDGEHWCSGALLNPRLVITTANCIWKAKRVSRMHVRVGSRRADEGGQLVAIQEVMKHPSWSIRTGPDNDVALMLLAERVKFSDKVHGVDLPNRIMMPAFQDAWITSWGADRRDGIYDKKEMTLQVYHARVLDRAKCNVVTQRFGITVTDNFICLAQDGKSAPCTRDTGAPAVSDGVLWGLASWGIRALCGTERYPAMFSYVASQTNMDFITNATRQLMADERFYPFPDRFPR